MSAARIYVLPAGELEAGGCDYEACARCGASSRYEPCHKSVVPAMLSACVLCDDVSACERRRYWNRARNLWCAP